MLLILKRDDASHAWFDGCLHGIQGEWAEAGGSSVPHSNPAPRLEDPTMMDRLARVMTATAALLLLALFAFPLWRIDLLAPQYPEGIGMLIRIDDVTGQKPQDLHNINSLNHYIGMKEIHAESIPELRWMPWLAGALVVTGLLVAAWGRRRALAAWLVVLLALGLAGLADFWRWAYDYGHDLDPDAIIK